MIFYLKKCNEVKPRKLKYRTNKANIIALSSMTSSQSLLHRSSQLTEGYRCVRFPSRLCIINENRLANFHELTHCTSFQIKETLKSIFFFFAMLFISMCFYLIPLHFRLFRRVISSLWECLSLCVSPMI